MRRCECRLVESVTRLTNGRVGIRGQPAGLPSLAFPVWASVGPPRLPLEPRDVVPLSSDCHYCLEQHHRLHVSSSLFSWETYTAFFPPFLLLYRPSSATWKGVRLVQNRRLVLGLLLIITK